MRTYAQEQYIERYRPSKFKGGVTASQPGAPGGDAKTPSRLVPKQAELVALLFCAVKSVCVRHGAGTVKIRESYGDEGTSCLEWPCAPCNLHASYAESNLIGLSCPQLQLNLLTAHLRLRVARVEIY